jgi:hypothetical protein
MFEDGILEQLTTVLDEESIQYDNREIFAGKKGLSL